MLLISNSNDAITGTKKKREPTVASTAVIFMHRMGVGSRDSLHLFNQKSFIMLPTNDVCTKSASIGQISPDEILNDLISQDSISSIRKDLREMVDVYLLSEDSKSCRERIYCSYLAIESMLSKTENLELTNNRRKTA